MVCNKFGGSWFSANLHHYKAYCTGPESSILLFTYYSFVFCYFFHLFSDFKSRSTISSLVLRSLDILSDKKEDKTMNVDIFFFCGNVSPSIVSFRYNSFFSVLLHQWIFLFCWGAYTDTYIDNPLPRCCVPAKRRDNSYSNGSLCWMNWQYFSYVSVSFLF